MLTVSRLGSTGPAGALLLVNTVAQQTGLLIAALAFSSGCAVGPDFRAPVLPDNAGYRTDDLPRSTVSAGHPPARRNVWSKALRFRLDGGRVLPAQAESPRRAGLRQQPGYRLGPGGTAPGRGAIRRRQGGLFPSVDAAAGANRQESPFSTGPVSGSASPYTIYNASIDVGYTLDLFGGVRRSVGRKTRSRRPSALPVAGHLSESCCQRRDHEHS
ncbi:hypothetical protein [Dokdonella sp.]|uniref:hypothetical protein n=1 Tax=Dokdonella sp. TaxID=2291710 RepID=UPI003528CF01